EAQQNNNLFQAEQEAKVALTTEKGLTAAALAAANRDAQIRAIEGRYCRENPELFELRKRELMVEMLESANLWFVHPKPDLTLLLDRMSGMLPTTVVEQAVQPNQPEPAR